MIRVSRNGCVNNNDIPRHRNARYKIMSRTRCVYWKPVMKHDGVNGQRNVHHRLVLHLLETESQFGNKRKKKLKWDTDLPLVIESPVEPAHHLNNPPPEHQLLQST